MLFLCVDIFCGYIIVRGHIWISEVTTNTKSKKNDKLGSLVGAPKSENIQFSELFKLSSHFHMGFRAAL